MPAWLAAITGNRPGLSCASASIAFVTQLLQRRALEQNKFDGGALPDFQPETRAIREDDTWSCAPPAPGLQDRRVEITGPVDRKMVSIRSQHAS